MPSQHASFRAGLLQLVLGYMVPLAVAYRNEKRQRRRFLDMAGVDAIYQQGLMQWLPVLALPPVGAWLMAVGILPFNLG